MDAGGRDRRQQDWFALGLIVDQKKGPALIAIDVTENTADEIIARHGFTPETSRYRFGQPVQPHA